MYLILKNLMRNSKILQEIVGYPCTDPIYIVDERIEFEEILYKFHKVQKSQIYETH